MPNWCNNHLRVSGPEADVERFKQQAQGYSPWWTEEERKGEEPDPLNFHSLVPIPDEVLTAGYEDAGYNLELANWGCKWGACHGELVDDWEGHVLYDFDTAWSPPIKFLEHIGPKYPSLTFLLDYEEGGAGFKGICKVQENVVEDHCISL